MSDSTLGLAAPYVNEDFQNSLASANIPPELRQTLAAMLKTIEAAAIAMFAAHAAAVGSLRPQPADPNPVKPPKPPRESFESREALAIQWLIAFDLQSDKLPTVSAIAKAAGINRCVLYSMKRFVAVYKSRKEERNRLAKLGRVRGPGGDVRRGFRTDGGGVEAVQDVDEFDEFGEC